MKNEEHYSGPRAITARVLAMVPLVLVGTARWLHIQAESVEAKVTIATTTLSLFMPLRSIDAPTRHRCRNRACGGTSDATNWTGESKAGDTTRRASADRLLGCRTAAQRQGDYDRKNKPRTHSNPSLAKIERPRHKDTDLPEPPRESRDSTPPPVDPHPHREAKGKIYPFLNDRLKTSARLSAWAQKPVMKFLVPPSRRCSHCSTK
jgi:hypothetical protein